MDKPSPEGNRVFDWNRSIGSHHIVGRNRKVVRIEKVHFVNDLGTR